MRESGTLEREGLQLRYQIEGSGPNTIVIGSAIYYPRLFSQELRNHLRMIFTDMRAFAVTPVENPSLDFDIDVLIEDIEALRQKLQLEKVIVIGHSGNAFLALEYAKKYKEHVSHVVLSGTAPSFSEENRALTDQYWEETASQERKETLKLSLEKNPDSLFETVAEDQRFIWNYLRLTPRIWYDFQFDARALWDGVQIHLPLFDYIWGTLYRDIDITKNLETLDRPVFLALGRTDFIVAPPTSWEPMQPLFQDLSIHLFEKSGHSPPYEEADLFNQTLLEWLA